MRAMYGYSSDVLTMIGQFANDVAEKTSVDKDRAAAAIIGFCLQVRDHALGKCEIDQMPTDETVERDRLIREMWLKSNEEDKS